ncbi:RNA exonuclease 1 homolog [Lytechinus pictus]|uniref:RNA exonuclease 1 homolog n=1 Tax=Lytechinus pictus TaxID=7653 RepID=UPI0030B9ECAA
MFPTAGLFRGVLCSENDESKGRCKRPYCHFRHVRRVPPVEAATETKNTVEQKAAKTRPAIESSSLPSHRRHRDRTPATKPIQYVPTPLFLCKKPSKDAFLEESTEEEEQGSKDEEVGSGEGVSAYTPTPLAELEAMDNPDEAIVPGGDDMLLMEAEAEDCSEDQSTNATKDDFQEMPSTDEKNLKTEQPSASEEMEDMVIETHTYGGVTVTTRTPRSLCKPDQASVEEEEEYNPFSSNFDSDEKIKVVMKGNACEKGNESYKKTSQSLRKDKEAIPETYLPEANFDPISKSDAYPTYGLSNDLANDFDENEKDFKGYSNTASYSYSDIPPMTGVDFHPYSYTSSDSHCINDVPPTYSTSGHVDDDSGFSMDIEEGYDMENLEQYHEEVTTKLELKKKFDKTNANDKQSRVKGHKVPEESESKTKSSVAKKVVLNKKKELLSEKKEVSGSSSKSMTPSKGKTSAASGKSVRVTSKAKPSQEKTDPKKLMSSNKKIMESKSGVKTQRREDDAKSGSKTVNSDNIKPSENTCMSDIKISEKEKVTERSKPKVSAEQLANFFKKHQEVKGLKSKGKQKIGELKRTTEDNSTSIKITKESKSLKSTSKGTSSHMKEINHKETVHSADAKVGTKGKQESPKTTGSDRSLFQSLGKPPTKVLPKKPTLKECNFDMFAIANDSSSDEEGVRSKTSSKSKAPVCSPPRKRSVSLDKNRHASGNDSAGQKKRTASPSKTNDPKRLKKLSTSQSKKESTKIIELDLFGDDSDSESDEVTLICNDSPQKILKKSAEVPRIKKQSSSSTSDLPRKVVRSGSGEVLSAGNFLPTTSKVKSSSVKTSKVGPSKKPSSSVTQKTPASGQNQVSKGPLLKNKIYVEKQSKFGSSLDSKNTTQENRKHQPAKNLSREQMHVYSLSDDSSDLPNGLVSSNDNESGDDDAGYDMGGSSNDTGNQEDGEGDEGDSEYMAEMRRFMEESSSEDDISDECYRIFQEEQAKARSRGHLSKLPKRAEERSSKSAPVSTGKQRVAHSTKFGDVKRKQTPKKPANSRLSAAQMCHNRYLMMERRLERASQEQEAGEATAGASITGKKRVAHQPVSTNNTLKQLTLGESSSEKKTTTVMTSKMGKRTAHMPRTVSKRPVIPTDYGSKVPMNIRQRYLNVFIDELLKTLEDDQDAFDKALEEEKLVYQRSSTKNIYLNLCVNALKKLKNQTDSRLQSPPSTPSVLFPSKVVSHEAVLGGKLAAQTSYSIHKHSNLDSESFEGIHLYDKLQRYILTEVQLRENGYPRPSDISGQAILFKEEANKKVASSDPNQQVCCRCGTTYLRLPNGKYITRESCTYHWGRPWTRRIAGMIESRFSCCSGDMETKGCCIAKYHVTNNKEGNLLGYMKTIPKDIPRNGHPGMYSLDCEMCYTSMGLELTRVTVIDGHLNEVYDTLVQPDNEVVDYNTRFSGITEDDLKHVRTKLRDVQAVLLNMFSAQTILIGHSLESDFLALKLMHSTVIDTAIVFPHRRGPPLKRALKTLMAEYLNRLIQDDVGGHDSTEDARSCMELMIYKVKEDAKVKRKR